MEDVAKLLADSAIDVQLVHDAELAQELREGLCRIVQEVSVARHDVCGREGVRHMRGNVHQVKLALASSLGEVVSHEGRGEVSGIVRHFDVVCAAVQGHSRGNKACRRGKVKLRGVGGIGAHVAEKAQHVAARGITHGKDMFRVKPVLIGVVKRPGEHRAGVLHARRELELWREAIRKVDHRKAAKREVHAVPLIALLVAIYPATTMDAYDDGQLSLGVLGTVHVQQLPIAVRAIGDVIKALDAIRRGKAGIADVVTLFELRADHIGHNGHGRPSSCSKPNRHHDSLGRGSAGKGVADGWLKGAFAQGQGVHIASRQQKRMRAGGVRILLHGTSPTSLRGEGPSLEVNLSLLIEDEKATQNAKKVSLG